MTIEGRIGIIGGNGWLGNAIAQAAVATGSVNPARLTLSGWSDDHGVAELPGAHWTKDNGELAAEVPLEAYIDYCVGVTGLGAAFPTLLAQAMIAHAVAQGLPSAFTKRAAKGVVVGASQLLAGEDSDPAQIVQAMIDYRGTTAAALQTMMDRGFTGSVAADLEAAAAKAAIASG